MQKLWLCCCLLILGGCSLSGPAARPAAALYLLEPASLPAAASAERAAARVACPSLRVSRPQSAPGYVTARMAYQRQDNQLEYFALHQWVDTPANMIGAVLARDLEASGLFAVVLSASAADVPTDLRLDSRLQRLRQVFEAGQSRLELELTVTLVDPVRRVVVLSRDLAYSEPVDPNPVAGVKVANQLLERFLRDLRTALEAPARAVAGSCGATSGSG